jgi:hypothetical protein
VIGVALFRERQMPRVVAPPVSIQQELAAAEQSAPAARAESKASNQAADAARAPAPAPSLGTGHGRREESLVSQVAFKRASSKPSEVIRIRYDSHSNLVAMGVIHQPAPRPRALDPFPNSPRVGYVPDP